MLQRTKGINGPKNLGERQNRMYSFMHEHPVGVLSTTDPNGNPHGTVVYYAVAKDLSVRFLTKKRTLKYDNLLHNNHLMITVFDPRTQSTLQYTGAALECAGQAATNELALELFEVPLQTSESGLPPIAKLQAGALTTFRVAPVQIRMAIYGRPETGDYTELFESIESFELDVT
jgi:hypothetical protein